MSAATRNRRHSKLENRLNSSPYVGRVPSGKRSANSMEEKDQVTSLPYLHLTYLMQCFIPRRYVETLLSVKTPTVFGCYAEGMRLPGLVYLKQEGYFVKRKFSKEPEVQFYHTKDANVSFPGETNSEECNYIISTESIHPGYCRLKVQGNETKEAQSDLEVNKKGVTYLSSAKSKKKFHEKLVSNKKAVDSLLDTLINKGDSNGFDMKFTDVFTGVPEASLDLSKRPHTTMGLRGILVSARKEKDQKKEEREQGFINDVEEYEVGHELAFPCLTWPNIASEWLTRKRHSKWPNERTIEKVKEGGIHVVPTPHKTSNDPEIEWKLSFAAAEKTLVIEEVDDSQKQCYLFFHLLCLHTLAEGCLQPGHLKTVFFHTCGSLDPKLWYTNPVSCVFFMFDALIEAVKKKMLCCYFLKKNNLLDHLTDLQLSQQERRLVAIRKKPLEELVSLAESNTILDVFPYNMNVRKLFAPIVADARKYVSAKQTPATIGCFMQISNLICNGFYEEFAFDHCASILDDLVDYIVQPALGTEEADVERDYIPHLLNQRNIEFSNILPLEEIWKPITFSRFIIRRYDDGKTMFELYAHLACLVHAAAHIFPEQRLPLLEQADGIFTESLKRQGETPAPGMIVEYAQFLLSCERYAEAVPHLTNVIKQEKENPTSCNYYGKMEAIVVDSFVQKEIEVRGHISILSIVYAYYLLLECYVKLKRTQLILSTFDEFEALCEKVNDSISFSLFGYAVQKYGDNTKAGRAFKKAVDLEPSNKLAKGNLSEGKKSDNTPNGDKQNEDNKDAAQKVPTTKAKAPVSKNGGKGTKTSAESKNSPNGSGNNGSRKQTSGTANTKKKK